GRRHPREAARREASEDPPGDPAGREPARLRGSSAAHPQRNPSTLRGDLRRRSRPGILTRGHPIEPTTDLSPAGGVPDGHAIAAMVLTAAALVLFTRQRLPLETSSLALLAVLTVGFALFPYPGLEPTALFAGFAHEALIAVCALMVLGQGLVQTGALEPVGRLLAQAWGRAPFFSFLATLVVGALLSAFVNNTPIVVLLLPILISVCLRTGTSASEVLMP